MKRGAASIGGFAVAVVLTFGGSAVRAADEPIVLISRIFVTPGQEAAYEERALKVVEFVRKAEPTTIYRLQRSLKEPSQFVFYEVYPSEAALEHHAKVVLPAFNKEFGPRPEGMVTRPNENERLRPLGK